MTISKQIFAAAAAHGLDPRVAATWHADLPRTPRVLVPIRVDALVVRQRGGTWADCRMRAPDAAANGVVPASSLMPDPFANLPQPRETGVYLHWALPDAMTRGVGSVAPDGATAAERAAEGISLPAIPDRWLVLRLGGLEKSLSRRSVSGWVIESGGLEPRVSPLDGWHEPGVDAAGPRKPLTALGHGDPAWSAYFDNVTNRLAFHDDLAGVKDGPLAYLVCGWYSDPALDVLGDAILSVAQFEQRLAELRWEVPPGSYGYAKAAFARLEAIPLAGLPTREGAVRRKAGSDTAGAPSYSTDQERGAAVDFQGRPIDGHYTLIDEWWPKYVLCHGGVVGIGWPGVGIPVAPSGLLGSGEELGGPPAADQVRVVVGHTLTDALSALLSTNNRTPDEARALEVALLGGADDLDVPDAPAQVDVRVHTASFGSLPSPATTETILQTPSAGPSKSPQPDPSRTDLGIFSDKVPKKGGKKGNVKDGISVSQSSVAVETRKDAGRGGVNVRANGTLADLIAEKRLKEDVGLHVESSEQRPRPVQVARATPRYFIPPDPVILLQGMGRSFKHGSDGLYSERGRLPCRVSGMTTRSLAPSALRGKAGNAAGVGGADLLERGVHNGSVPLECEELLQELALLDPGSATFAARAGSRGKKRLAAKAVRSAARTYAVEQTAWWATWDPRRDAALLAAKSGFEGTLPCGLAVSAPLKPWVPLHLDWEVEYFESPGGLEDWQLGEIDFDARPAAIPPVAPPPGTVLTGRALLTAGAAQTAASAVLQTLDRTRSAGGSASLEPGSVEQFPSELARALLEDMSQLHANLDDSDLRSLAEALGEMDVLAGALDRFHTRLRGGFVADGRAQPAAGDPQPAPFVALRAGFLRIRRLRLVDCFGQVLDLAGSSAVARVDMSTVVRSEPMTVLARPDLLELAPRFTAPTRLMFRFVAADNDAEEASDDRSPLCGFVLPDHLDAELQFHGTDGAAFGSVRFDALSGVRWEDAPGSPTSLGSAPARAISSPHLAGVAQGLLDWGGADTTRNDPNQNDTALSAILRIIDTTLWTVDPFAHTGDEHLSLLVGHPIAALRARLSLDVAEPIDPNALQSERVPVRLGALAHWQDGLLAYFVDDDYRTLFIPDPAAASLARPIGPGQGFLQSATQTSDYYRQFAADIGVAVNERTPVNHDFVDTSGVVHLRPGQTVMLTLLVEPHSVVHATSGLLPRKAIGMRRQWVANGLANIAPSLRFGPVLVDAKRIRMPVASELHGTWSWCHRVDPTTWQEDEVVNSSQDAQLPTSPVEGHEGWLKLTPDKPGTP